MRLRSRFGLVVCALLVAWAGSSDAQKKKPTTELRPPLVSNTKGTPIKTFATREAFVLATEDEAEEALHSVPLDPRLALDGQALGILADLKMVAGITRPVRLWWADGSGSSAHPQAGIALDRIELEDIKTHVSSGDFNTILTFALAHELSHVAQYGTYDLHGIFKRENTRAVECQADILGGMLVVEVALMKAQAPSLIANRMAEWFAVAMRIGSPAWDDQTVHPRPEQRARAVSLGFNAGLQAVDIERFKRTNDEQSRQRIRDAEASNPDMLRLDDNLFDWSNRVAKKIVRADGRVPPAPLDYSKLTRTCQFSYGPRAGQTALLSGPALVIGAGCSDKTDGSGSVGVAIADGRDVGPVILVHTCLLNAGPAAGTRVHAVGPEALPLGAPCQDGIASTGQAVLDP
jgi:hypothetical protein